MMGQYVVDTYRSTSYRGMQPDYTVCKRRCGDLIRMWLTHQGAPLVPGVAASALEFRNCFLHVSDHSTLDLAVEDIAAAPTVDGHLCAHDFLVAEAFRPNTARTCAPPLSAPNSVTLSVPESCANVVAVRKCTTIFRPRTAIRVRRLKVAIGPVLLTASGVSQVVPCGNSVGQWYIGKLGELKGSLCGLDIA